MSIQSIISKQMWHVSLVRKQHSWLKWCAVWAHANLCNWFVNYFLYWLQFVGLKNIVLVKQHVACPSVPCLSKEKQKGLWKSPVYILHHRTWQSFIYNLTCNDKRIIQVIAICFGPTLYALHDLITKELQNQLAYYVMSMIILDHICSPVTNRV